MTKVLAFFFWLTAFICIMSAHYDASIAWGIQALFWLAACVVDKKEVKHGASS
jgi:hypothetical protein